MMKFFGIIILLAYNISLVLFASCMLGSESTKEYALAVRPSDDGFEFASVSRSVSGEFNLYLSRHKENQLYYLCPYNENHTLLKIKKRVNANYDGKKQICQYAVEPSILKVNIQIAMSKRVKTPMHKYGIGFTIDYNKFKGSLGTNYESLDDNHYFLPMISVYANPPLKLIFAVSYKIITVDTKKKLENTTLTYKSTDFFPNKIEQFYKNQESILREKLGLHYDAEKHILELGSLVNENDFIIDTWKKTARYKIHQILIWKHNIEMWSNIQEYARHVGALSMSETAITAGIGEALTISDSESQPHVMRWGEGEDTVFIPELYWLAISYCKDQETTGMVIIMHNDLVDGANVKKVCDKNPCVDKETWIWREENNEFQKTVYCCKLKTEVLKKLGIEYMHRDLYFYKGDSSYYFPPLWETNTPVPVN